MPSYHDDISERDLSEAPRLERESQSRGLLIGIVAGAALFVGLLIFASRPDLSPEEIISMEGYAGEQPTRHIFNLQSFEESQISDQNGSQNNSNVPTDEAPADKVLSKQTTPMHRSGEEVDNLRDDQIAVKQVVPPVPESPIESPTTERIVADEASSMSSQIREPDTQALPAEKAETIKTVAIEPEVATTQASVVPAIVQTAEELIEQPVSSVESASPDRASIFDDIPEQRVVAAMATTPKLEEQPDTVVVSTAVVDELTPMPIGGTSTGDISLAGKGVLLPLRSVLNDATELKDAPDENSKTLLLLGQGVVVTALERRGEWILIGTNDSTSVTGYVLESGLEKVDSQ